MSLILSPLLSLGFLGTLATAVTADLNTVCDTSSFCPSLPGTGVPAPGPHLWPAVIFRVYFYVSSVLGAAVCPVTWAL